METEGITEAQLEATRHQVEEEMGTSDVDKMEFGSNWFANLPGTQRYLYFTSSNYTDEDKKIGELDLSDDEREYYSEFYKDQTFKGFYKTVEKAIVESGLDL